ncbi:barstar family protein [Streptomyces sp. A30]|uniref:barstar family protein n=1 Tax=Streptomyces sp. A30 TaxID=2789273 RepID=UPI00397ED093
MNAPTLAARRPPWVVFTASNDPWVTAETAALQKQSGIPFRLDGRELLQPASLFRAFARELSFLGYFGHNWDALVDCLHDWHGPGHGNRDVAVLIDDADDLLGAEFLGLFVSVLCQAAWAANFQLDADGIPYEDRPPFALHFVLLLDHTPPAAFAEETASGAGVEVALTDGRLTATFTGEDFQSRASPTARPRPCVHAVEGEPSHGQGLSRKG